MFLSQLHKTPQRKHLISNKQLQAAIADLSSIPGADDSDEPAPANKPAPVLFPLRAGGGTVVHAVVLVAAVRRLSRQLLFADLLPPGSDRDSDRSIWRLGRVWKGSWCRGKALFHSVGTTISSTTAAFLFNPCVGRDRPRLSPDGSGRPMRLQLLVGRSLAERVGQSGAASVIKRLRAQQPRPW